ncbi:MAG: hypothetical protein AB7G12_05985 [Thermoanaerobaculia bacterium]
MTDAGSELRAQAPREWRWHTCRPTNAVTCPARNTAVDNRVEDGNHRLVRVRLVHKLEARNSGSYFVNFREPGSETVQGQSAQNRVKVKGADIFGPKTGEIRCGDVVGVARWAIDSDYTEGEIFARNNCFLGANVPCKALKTTL